MGSICNKKTLNEVDKKLLESSSYSKPSNSERRKTNKSSSRKNINTINLSDFIIRKQIGKGSFGKVYLVESKADYSFYAMKILDKGKIKENDLVENSKVERIILSTLSFPFIVQLHCSFQSTSRLFLVTEYIAGGDLFKLMIKLGRFTENQIKLYLAEIILSLNYLHENNCIYRDLKPENILIANDGHIKLIDFGLTKMFFDNIKTNENKIARAESICGTAEYMAPEVITDENYDNRVDWFSLGAIAYYFYTGYAAFNCKNQPLDVSIKQKPLVYNPQIFDNITEAFISSLLNFYPQHRLGTNGVKEIIAHPYFEGIDFEKVLNKDYSPEYIPCLKESMIEEPSYLAQDDALRETYKDDNMNIPMKNISNKKGTYEGFTYVRDDIQIVNNMSSLG